MNRIRVVVTLYYCRRLILLFLCLIHMSSLIISQRWLPNVIISPLSPSSFFIGLLMLISRILRQIRLTINIVNLIT